LAEELELETQLVMATAEENAYLEADKTETTILQQRSDKPTRMGSSQREYDARIQSDAPNVVESPNVNECETVDTSADQTCSTKVRKRNAGTLFLIKTSKPRESKEMTTTLNLNVFYKPKNKALMF
jgi:PAB1-binding protein PBP1